MPDLQRHFLILLCFYLVFHNLNLITFLSVLIDLTLFLPCFLLCVSSSYSVFIVLYFQPVSFGMSSRLSVRTPILINSVILNNTVNYSWVIDLPLDLQMMIL